MPDIVDITSSITGREQVLLDPSEVATGRVELDLTEWVAEAGPDWGDAQIEQYLAEAQRGQLPVDFRVPNRQVTIPLVLRDAAGATFNEMRRAVQAKTALFQREGGWLKRDTAVGPVYADIVNASLKLGGSTAQALYGVDADAVLTFETLPDFYGEEVELDEITSAGTELVGVLEQDGVAAAIAGDYPARVRILVRDEASVARFGVLWGIRSRHYSSDPTAQLAYEAEALTPLDQASVTTLAGASGGASNNRVSHPLVGPSWTPVLSTRIASGSADMTHTGAYRVWVRAFSTSSIPPRLRLVWDTGEINAPVENAPKSPAASSRFYDLDLGEVRLDAAPVGTHRWQGQIQAAGVVGENITIDKVWLVPIDEGYGLLRMTLSSLTGAISARDEFTDTVHDVALNTRVAPVGGAWATSGDAGGDFKFCDPNAPAPESGGFPITNTSEGLIRTVASATPRFAILGSSITDQVVEVDIIANSASTSFGESGVIARWVDANNYLRFTLTPNNELQHFGPATLQLVKVVGGVATVLATGTRVIGPNVTDTGMHLALTVRADGSIDGTLYDQNGGALLRLTASDAVLATGGALETGKSGLIDTGTTTFTSSKVYDNFKVSVPAPQPIVLNAGRSAELRSDGMFREDSSGTSYDSINYVVGDLPRLPPSGMEQRPVEIFLKASRGDFDERADSGIDALSAQVIYRPSWLFVPEPVGP